MPRQLPVMASLVESSLHNDNFGDRDSDRVLPDAHDDLGPRPLPGLREEPPAPGEVVPGPGRAGQQAVDRVRPGRRPEGPEQVRRLDRRRRAARRRVPRPLPAAARRGQPAARRRGAVAGRRRVAAAAARRGGPAAAAAAPAGVPGAAPAAGAPPGAVDPAAAAGRRGGPPGSQTAGFGALPAQQAAAAQHGGLPAGGRSGAGSPGGRRRPRVHHRRPGGGRRPGHARPARPGRRGPSATRRIRRRGAQAAPRAGCPWRTGPRPPATRRCARRSATSACTTCGAGPAPRPGSTARGLTQYAYHQVGIDIPRVAEDQFHAGTGVDRGDLRAGDLVFFSATPGGLIHHVGMYIGGGKFIHSPHTGDVVKVSSLDEPYFKQQFAGGRRFAHLEAAAGDAAAPSAAPAAAAPAAVADPAAAAQAASTPPGAAVAPRAPPSPRWRAPTPPRRRDAAVGQRPASARFQAVPAQEALPKGPTTAVFMKAIDRRRSGAPGIARRRVLGGRPGAAHAPRRPARRPARPLRPEAAAAAQPGGDALARAARWPWTPPASARDYPGDRARRPSIAQWLSERGPEAGPAAGASGDGLARRVRACRTSTTATPTPSASSRCASASGTRAPTRAIPETRSCRSSGSSTRRSRSSSSAIARGRRPIGGPAAVGRLDRRHRAPGGAVPRPLPAAPRRGAGPAAGRGGGLGHDRARGPGGDPALSEADPQVFLSFFVPGYVQ